MSAYKIYVLQLHPEPKIIELNPDGTGLRAFAELPGHTPDGLVVDPRTSSIMWTHMGAPTNVGKGEALNADGAIFRTGIDGVTVPIIGWGQIVTPKQLLGDFDGGHLYWGDREGLRLMRADMDGSNVTVLVRAGVFPKDSTDQRLQCVGVAIDHQTDRIFWTQKGAPDSGTGRIFMAGIKIPEGETPDNRSDVTVLASDLPEPIDLEYSAIDNALYWTDRGNLAGGNSLNRIRFEGNVPQEKEVLATGLQEEIGLALDEENRRAFVSDLDGNLRVIELDSEHRSTVIARLGMLTGIAYAPALS